MSVACHPCPDDHGARCMQPCPPDRSACRGYISALRRGRNHARGHSSDCSGRFRTRAAGRAAGLGRSGQGRQLPLERSFQVGRQGLGRPEAAALKQQQQHARQAQQAQRAGQPAADGMAPQVRTQMTNSAWLECTHRSCQHSQLCFLWGQMLKQMAMALAPLLVAGSSLPPVLILRQKGTRERRCGFRSAA